MAVFVSRDESSDRLLGPLAAVGFDIWRGQLISSGMDIEAHAEKADGYWKVSGIVLGDGMPLTGAKVWGIASDPRGNHYAASANTTTDIFGAFTLDSIPQKSDSNVNVTKTEVSVTCPRSLYHLLC